MHHVGRIKILVTYNYFDLWIRLRNRFLSLRLLLRLFLLELKIPNLDGGSQPIVLFFLYDIFFLFFVDKFVTPRLWKLPNLKFAVAACDKDQLRPRHTLYKNNLIVCLRLHQNYTLAFFVQISYSELTFTCTLDITIQMRQPHERRHPKLVISVIIERYFL